MFWFLNKKTNTPAIVGSIPVLEKLTGIKSTRFEYLFSRLKKTEYEDEHFRIHKLPVSRSERKSPS